MAKLCSSHNKIGKTENNVGKTEFKPKLDIWFGIRGFQILQEYSPCQCEVREFVINIFKQYFKIHCSKFNKNWPDINITETNRVTKIIHWKESFITNVLIRVKYVACYNHKQSLERLKNLIRF